MNPLHVINRIIDSLATIDDDTAAAPPITAYQSLGEPKGSGFTDGPTTAQISLIEAKVGLGALTASWCLLVREEGNYGPPASTDLAGMAEYLRSHAGWLAGHPAVEDFIDEMGRAIGSVHRLIDSRSDTRQFVGVCDGRPIYASEGQTHVVVGDEVVDVEGSRQSMRDDLRHRSMPEAQAAAVCRSVFGIDVDAKSVRNRRTYMHRKGLPFGTRGSDNRWRYTPEEIINWRSRLAH